MMNTMLWRKLFVVAAAPMNSNLCCKLFCIHPFHFRNAFSTEAHSQSLFSQFASSKLNMSEADITRILKSAPHLQTLRTLHELERCIDTLKKHGCSEVLIANIIRHQPGVIRLADNTLECEVRLLEDLGFVDRNLSRLLTINPFVLGSNLKNIFLPKMEFLKDVFQFQGVFVKALLRAPRLLSYSLEKTLKPSLAFWEGWGFSGKGLLSFLKVYPTVLKCTSLTPAQMELIHKIGTDKENKMFKYIVGIVAMSRTKTLEAKIENLRLCGLSAEETRQVLGAVPLVLCFSKENVREKMSFIVYEMEFPANIVVKHAGLLQINLEKTMRPRFLVWQKIKSISDLDLPLLPLLTVLRMSEARFVSKIIKGHPESETLWTVYENAISNVSIAQRAQQKYKFGRRK